MILRHYYIFLLLALMVSCKEKDKFTKEDKLLSIEVNKNLRILFSQDSQNLSLIKENDSMIVIFKFEQNKLRQIDSIYLEEETGGIISYLLEQDLTFQQYNRIGYPTDDIKFTLERGSDEDFLVYQKKISTNRQDFNQSFCFENDSLNLDLSLFYRVFINNNNEEQVKFYIPLTEEESNNYIIKIDVYDLDFDSSNWSVIENRIYIPNDYLIESYLDIKPDSIVIPFNNQKIIRITMFESSSKKAYSTFLFDLNKENEFYNRIFDDYKKVKEIVNKVSINTIVENIVKDLEHFNGFKYENEKVIIDSLMKDKILNY